MSKHRDRETSRSFVREKCRRCRESYRLGTLDRTGVCSLCRAEIVDLPRNHDDRLRFAQPKAPRRRYIQFKN